MYYGDKRLVIVRRSKLVTAVSLVALHEVTEGSDHDDNGLLQTLYLYKIDINVTVTKACHRCFTCSSVVCTVVTVTKGLTYRGLTGGSGC